MDLNYSLGKQWEKERELSKSNVKIGSDTFQKQEEITEAKLIWSKL